MLMGASAARMRAASATKRLTAAAVFSELGVRALGFKRPDTGLLRVGVVDGIA